MSIANKNIATVFYIGQFETDTNVVAALAAGLPRAKALTANAVAEIKLRPKFAIRTSPCYVIKLID